MFYCYENDKDNPIFFRVLIGLKFSLPTDFIVEHHAINICILAHYPQSFGEKLGMMCDRPQLLVQVGNLIKAASVSIVLVQTFDWQIFTTIYHSLLLNFSYRKNYIYLSQHLQIVLSIQLMRLLATKNRRVYRIFKIERQQRVFFKFLIKNRVLGVKRVKN